MAASTGSSVQLSVRLPERLRARVRASAAREGRSVQDWVRAVLEVATDRADDPMADVTDRMVADARAALAEAVRDGSYTEAVHALDDPDLVTQ